MSMSHASPADPLSEKVKMTSHSSSLSEKVKMTSPPDPLSEKGEGETYDAG